MKARRPSRKTPSTIISSARGRSTLAMGTVDMTEATARSWWDVPTSSASDLSGLSYSLFCMYHCLTSLVHAATTDSPVALLSARMARWTCVISILVVLNAVIGDDISHWTAVDGEQ